MAGITSTEDGGGKILTLCYWRFGLQGRAKCLICKPAGICVPQTHPDLVRNTLHRHACSKTARNMLTEDCRLARSPQSSTTPAVVLILSSLDFFPCVGRSGPFFFLALVWYNGVQATSAAYGFRHTLTYGQSSSQIAFIG